LETAPKTKGVATGHRHRLEEEVTTHGTLEVILAEAKILGARDLAGEKLCCVPHLQGSEK